MTDRSEVHVLDKWRHLGTADADADLREILRTRADAPFDAGTYKMLVQYFRLMSRDSEIIKLQ
jgi:hypothetical protein